MGRRVPGNVPHSSEQWLQSAVRYLARSDRTAAQVERFLRNKGASPSQARHTVSRLSELNYLDDLAYAERWIEGRLTRKPLGRERLKAELLSKGVTESAADRVIRKALTGIDEEMLARRALTMKQRQSPQLTPVQAWRLLRRWGFEDETIARIIGMDREAEGPYS